MKLFRFALNIWITVASVGSFLLGWVALAHAPKPVQPQVKSSQVSPAIILPTLTPLQNLQFGGDDNNFPSFQQLPSNGIVVQQQPIFRTSGS